MSSCTNSSNIRSTLLTQIIREEADGRRVSFKISTADAGISAGITLGSVIRYDPATQTYDLSKADKPETAEVIGVVESINEGVYTVVASGLMVYPNINSVINGYTGDCQVYDSGTGGGLGGPDILFLSNGCAGKVQLIEPTVPGHIVKPILQRVKVGAAGPNQYNSIVLNYIGYEVSPFAQTEDQFIFPPASVYYAPETDNIDGFLDARTEHLLPVSDYSELYSVFDTDYGLYEETVSISNPLANLSLLAGSSTKQVNLNGSVYTSGTVVSTTQSPPTLTIRKNSTERKTDTTKQIEIGTQSFTLVSSSVTKFTVPSVPTQTIRYSASSGSKDVTLVPYMRTKQNSSSVSIPSKVVVDRLESDTLITGIVNVGAKLTELQNRIATLESRIGIIPV